MRSQCLILWTSVLFGVLTFTALLASAQMSDEEAMERLRQRIAARAAEQSNTQPATQPDNGLPQFSKTDATNTTGAADSTAPPATTQLDAQPQTDPTKKPIESSPESNAQTTNN